MDPQTTGAKSLKLVANCAGEIAGQKTQGQRLKCAGIDVGWVARLSREVERVGQESVVRMILGVSLQDAGSDATLCQGTPGAALIESGKLDQAVGVNQTAPLYG
jgi:hypothetical protein